MMMSDLHACIGDVILGVSSSDVILVLDRDLAHGILKWVSERAVAVSSSFSSHLLFSCILHLAI